jgi:hypothetical protein
MQKWCFNVFNFTLHTNHQKLFKKKHSLFSVIIKQQYDWKHGLEIGKNVKKKRLVLTAHLSYHELRHQLQTLYNNSSVNQRNKQTGIITTRKRNKNYKEIGNQKDSPDRDCQNKNTRDEGIPFPIY